MGHQVNLTLLDAEGLPNEADSDLRDVAGVDFFGADMIIDRCLILLEEGPSGTLQRVLIHVPEVELHHIIPLFEDGEVLPKGAVAEKVDLVSVGGTGVALGVPVGNDVDSVLHQLNQREGELLGSAEGPKEQCVTRLSTYFCTAAAGFLAGMFSVCCFASPLAGAWPLLVPWPSCFFLSFGGILSCVLDIVINNYNLKLIIYLYILL